MSALEPGLYRATVRGISGESIVLVGSEDLSYSLTPDGDVRRCYVFTDARPLIVLDLEYPQIAVRALEMAVRDHTNGDARTIYRAIANQIEAQTKPARIPEPDPGERVTACARNTPDLPEKFLRLRWSKTKDAEGWHWVSLATGHVYEWDNLIDPTLTREGVES